MWREAFKFGAQSRELSGIGDISHFHTDGYRQHSMANRDVANGKLKYALSPDTSLTLVGNSLRQPQTQDPLGLSRALVDQDPRQVTPQAIQFNTRKTVNQEQAGLSLNHLIDPANSVQAVLYGGNRWVEQYLGFSGATSSGGVVNLDTDYGGGALRYFRNVSSVRLSTGVEYETMKQRRKGLVNNNGVSGALRRDEDDEVSSSGVFAQGEWKFAERWSVHAGVRAGSVRFRATDFFLSNGDDGGSKTYRGTTPVAGLVFRPTNTTSIYGNVGRGLETPTLVELANRSGGVAGLNFALEASRSRHGELGYRQEPFYAQLEPLHKSRVPVNDPNSEFADAYTTLNLMAGVVQQGRGWRITEFARIDNLTDRNYVGSVIVNETNSRFYEP